MNVTMITNNVISRSGNKLLPYLLIIALASCKKEKDKKDSGLVDDMAVAIETIAEQASDLTRGFSAAPPVPLLSSNNMVTTQKCEVVATGVVRQTTTRGTELVETRKWSFQKEKTVQCDGRSIQFDFGGAETSLNLDWNIRQSTGSSSLLGVGTTVWDLKGEGDHQVLRIKTYGALNFSDSKNKPLLRSLYIEREDPMVFQFLLEANGNIRSRSILSGKIRAVTKNGEDYLFDMRSITLDESCRVASGSIEGGRGSMRFSVDTALNDFFAFNCRELLIPR